MFYKYVNNRRPTGWLKKVSCCTVTTAYFFEPPCISHRSTIGALTIVTSDGDIANMFNMYYANVGVVDDGIVPPCPSVAVRSTIESIRFDEASFLAAINKVKPILSAGPDGLPPLLFKQLRYSLARPLSLYFTTSFFLLVLFHLLGNRPSLHQSLKKAQSVLFPITGQYHSHALLVRLWSVSLQSKFVCIC